MRSRLGTIFRRSAAEASSWISAAAGPPQGHLRIIYYHRIDDEEHRSCVSIKAFAEQMAFLRDEGWTVLTLKEVANHLATGTDFPQRAIAVTFDDGFRDNYTAALPILQKHEIPATVFLTTDFIGASELPVLRDRSGVEPLDWDEVRAMAAAGVQLGAHTMTHPSLDQLPAEAMASEIRECRTRIQEETGVWAEDFCYPRGHYNEVVENAVREAGYQTGLTTRPGVVTPGDPPFTLRRTFIARDDRLRDFSHKLDGSYDRLHALKQTWGRLRSPARAQ